MHNFLDNIKQSVIERVTSLPKFHHTPLNTLDFCDIFKNKNEPTFITEIKFASPSLGKIYKGTLDHIAIANEYLSNGASALSVLAEPHYFKGDITYIENIRHTFPQAHILLKDFILSKKQIAQGLASGANAILLIVAFLDKTILTELHEYAISLGLTPIIEVHNLEELQIALTLSPRIIGINNRNLKTLNISLDISRELIKHIPNECYAICESGIDNKIEIDKMRALGFDGFLIGSSLMKHAHPGEALKNMLNGKQNDKG
ncbi:MAG: trpC 2 [Gammaproteobacteria bacterium]|nr:trpC 2 [Gammaproteobacteria bacterium]